MTRGPRFWLLLAVFQVVFGLTVFAITRQYYIQDTGNVGDQPNVAARSDTSTSSLPTSSPSTLSSPALEDPDAVAHLANQAFADQQYDRAAELYERLVVLAPDNVNAHNNLGITLHYLGRSTEALGVLEEGVSLDPTYQRIWLTLGFVNSQLGNIDEARTALETATELDAENDIGLSAAAMLEGLPRDVPRLVGSQ